MHDAAIPFLITVLAKHLNNFNAKLSLNERKKTQDIYYPKIIFCTCNLHENQTVKTLDKIQITQIDSFDYVAESQSWNSRHISAQAALCIEQSSRNRILQI